MADLKYINLNLYSDAYYSYTTSLEGQAYSLTIQWNERVQGWFLSIRTDDNTLIISGVRIVPNYPILIDDQIDTLTGFFYLESKSDIDSTKFNSSPRLLYQYFNFYYIYEE